MFNFVQKVCKQVCRNLFENSEKLCISNFFNDENKENDHSSLYILSAIGKINTFCQGNKNRFWVICYRLTESRVMLTCLQSQKRELCQDYVLPKVMKYIKEFNSEEESVVFKKVRSNLTQLNQHYKKTSSKLEVIVEEMFEKNYGNNTEEVIHHYTTKIMNEYQTKAFDSLMGIAFVENALITIEDSEVKSKLESRLCRYKVYQSPLVLNDFVHESCMSDRERVSTVQLPLLIELLNKEKFLNYIKQPIESRHIDFLRSKLNTETEIEEATDSHHKEDDGITLFDEDELSDLTNDEKLLYKLKFGIKLYNREFLSATYTLDYNNDAFLDQFTSEEKLYIKFSVHYGLDDSSKHFACLLSDIREIKASISQKISSYRETVTFNSYNKDEVFIKLIYHEPLSAKEMGTVLGLTDKQVYKKVEKITKKLRRHKD